MEPRISMESYVEEVEDAFPDHRPGTVQLGEPSTEAPPPEDPRPLARRGMKTFRAGPKGVIADRNEAVLKMRAHRLRDKISSLNKIKRIALGAAAPLNAPSHQTEDDEKRRKGHPEDSDGSDFSDEDLIDAYKKDRIRLAHEERPSFGTLGMVTAKNFLQHVDGTDVEVTILIHLYQDYLERCAHMNDTLARIAAAFPHVKFLKGRSDKILPNYPDEGCPSFIIFRGGDQIMNLVRVLDDIGNPWRDEDVVAYLRAKGVLPPLMAAKEGKLKNALNGEVDSEDELLEKLRRAKVSAVESDSDSELDL